MDHGFWPNWSPDGRELSFSDRLRGGALGVVPVDSGPPRILLDGTHGIDADKAYWSANGRELIFHGHDARGRAAMYSIPAAGGTPRLLALFEDPNLSALRGNWAFGARPDVLQCGRTAERRVGDGAGAAVSATMERLAAALADRYRIERELGAGGMATVYLAQDLKHDRKVAIKVLRPELGASLGPERFLQEIRVAAKLQHPHIVGLLDSGVITNGPGREVLYYYVMPFVEGETLRERLARSGPLPVPEVVRLTAEIADALAKAHKAGVVHRDIKPENILLADGHALVMDFGVAKAVSDATGRQGLTSAGMSLGTPAYMAPEQVAADPRIDHRADLYALGLVAYEMLVGGSPYAATTPQQQMAAHLTQDAGADPAASAPTVRPPWQRWSCGASRRTPTSAGSRRKMSSPGSGPSRR